MFYNASSWQFVPPPVIYSAACVGGHMEGQGPLATDFDSLHDNSMLDEKTFEQAEQKMMEEACRLAISKASLQPEDINLFLAGDLLNQITTSCFSARNLSIPFLGLFGACSTAMEALALAGILCCAGARRVLVASGSHNNCAEKQFRYPNEYGAQKKPTTQCTVTAAGAAIVSTQHLKGAPLLSAATIGRVVDKGISDPFNMGAAMAPAAADTISRHFRETGRQPSDYDLIMTGDLGKVGHSILQELLLNEGWDVNSKILTDGGMMIYGNNPEVFSGGSGCGCCAAVTFGHLYRRLLEGELRRILVVATGSLMSPLTFQQRESIPGVAHAVVIEGGM